MGNRASSNRRIQKAVTVADPFDRGDVPQDDIQNVTIHRAALRFSRGVYGRGLFF